jgi:L-ascorbate metabolism protein UlaG (beta-lactamase superfamily)
VIGMVELAGFLGKKGVRNAVGANFGGTVQFDGGSVKIVPAWHTSSYNDEDGTVVPLGIPAGLVVKFGGKTIYFAGDTCLFGDMALIGEEGLDVAVLPIGDHFTMGPEDAVRAAKLLNAGTVIPCHYNTFPPIRQDPHQWAADVNASTSSMTLILRAGEPTEL